MRCREGGAVRCWGIDANGRMAEREERVRFVRGMNELNLEMVFGPGHSSGSQAIRPCPLCRQPFGHATLGTIEVDRCGQRHGIWFDAGELESVLKASTAGVPWPCALASVLSRLAVRR